MLYILVNTTPTFFSISKIRTVYLLQALNRSLRVRSFGMIRIRISDPRSLGSWCIKGAAEFTLDKDSAAPLMHHDPSDLGSLILIWIIPKERTLKSITRNFWTMSTRTQTRATCTLVSCRWFDSISWNNC